MRILITVIFSIVMYIISPTKVKETKNEICNQNNKTGDDGASRTIRRKLNYASYVVMIIFQCTLSYSFGCLSLCKSNFDLHFLFWLSMMSLFTCIQAHTHWHFILFRVGLITGT